MDAVGEKASYVTALVTKNRKHVHRLSRLFCLCSAARFDVLKSTQRTICEMLRQMLSVHGPAMPMKVDSATGMLLIVHAKNTFGQ